MVSKAEKSPNAFRTISEVADFMGVPQHVLRFWESKFSQISPMKRGGGRRYYRPEDIEIIEAIRNLLHEDGYTIKGAQKYLKEHGVKNALKMANVDPDQKTEITESDYESQILNITKKSIKTIEDEANTADALKKIRIQLEKIRRQLKTNL
ncbi:MAG: MerR family transcriptional regulator [Alphaproteobacteria bacterium]|nr:MerR family transcriptional regulator [Alphaproteobacteria bacterium]